jgi:hypothetical protein
MRKSSMVIADARKPEIRLFVRRMGISSSLRVRTRGSDSSEGCAQARLDDESRRFPDRACGSPIPAPFSRSELPLARIIEYPAPVEAILETVDQLGVDVVGEPTADDADRPGCIRAGGLSDVDGALATGALDDSPLDELAERVPGRCCDLTPSSSASSISPGRLSPTRTEPFSMSSRMCARTISYFVSRDPFPAILRIISDRTYPVKCLEQKADTAESCRSGSRSARRRSVRFPGLRVRLRGRTGHPLAAGGGPARPGPPSREARSATSIPSPEFGRRRRLR